MCACLCVPVHTHECVHVYVYLPVCMYVHVCATAHVWKLEDNLQKLFLLLYESLGMSSGPRLGSKHI